MTVFIPTYTLWRNIGQYLLYGFLIFASLSLDVSLFYMNVHLPIPTSICLCVCFLTYASLSTSSFFLFFIAILPVALTLSWGLFMLPLVAITLIGLSMRLWVYHQWLIPYLLATFYIGITSSLYYAQPTHLWYGPPLTIAQLFIILIVIKLFSLIVSSPSRQGNRV